MFYLLFSQKLSVQFLIFEALLYFYKKTNMSYFELRQPVDTQIATMEMFLPAKGRLCEFFVFKQS